MVQVSLQQRTSSRHSLLYNPSHTSPHRYALETSVFGSYFGFHAFGYSSGTRFTMLRSCMPVIAALMNCRTSRLPSSTKCCRLHVCLYAPKAQSNLIVGAGIRELPSASE